MPAALFAYFSLFHAFANFPIIRSCLALSLSRQTLLTKAELIPTDMSYLFYVNHYQILWFLRLRTLPSRRSSVPTDYVTSLIRQALIHAWKAQAG